MSPPSDTFDGITLRVGDVLLERAGLDLNSIIISVGQKLGGSSKATTVHAAIYVGNGFRSESTGVGLSTVPFNHKNKWKIYRNSVRPDIAECAADIAQNLVIRTKNDGGFGEYSKLRATKSAILPGRKKVHSANDVSNFLNNVSRYESHNARTFFCSNFVVLCYSLASEFLSTNPHFCIDLDYERASPGAMAEYFENHRPHWNRVGEIRG